MGNLQACIGNQQTNKFVCYQLAENENKLNRAKAPLKQLEQKKDADCARVNLDPMYKRSCKSDNQMLNHATSIYNMTKQRMDNYADANPLEKSLFNR